LSIDYAIPHENVVFESYVNTSESDTENEYKNGNEVAPVAHDSSVETMKITNKATDNDSDFMLKETLPSVNSEDKEILSPSEQEEEDEKEQSGKKSRFGWFKRKK